MNDAEAYALMGALVEAASLAARTDDDAALMAVSAAIVQSDYAVPIVAAIASGSVGLAHKAMLFDKISRDN